MLRKGQAMIETVIAVLVVTSAFLFLFKLSHVLTGKIMLEHAAMRVARARSVGFNDFMCRKTARVAVIPVAGRRLWPRGDEFDWAMELSRVPIYMQAPTPGRANGLLEYAGWDNLHVDQGDGTNTKISLANDWFNLRGEAGIEDNAGLYLENQGL